jgi:hypothetical protein
LKFVTPRSLKVWSQDNCTPNRIEEQGLASFGAVIAKAGSAFVGHHNHTTSHMDAAPYFELVDAIARIDGQAELDAVTERVMATVSHPLERQVLERALRARTESLALQRELLRRRMFRAIAADVNPLAAQG